MAYQAHYSYAMPNESQLELDSLEELDEFDYDPNFFDGISFNKDADAQMTAPPAYLRAYPESPSPSLAGYTSEESGYSSSNDHGGKWSPTSDTSNASKRTTINEGTMTNGKTSIYRGVTRTSKTAWGAKYSSKRIVNTCKTEEEAARKYDEYIKLNVPDKYLKYANFCPKCDKYTNSLGLTWTTKECQCSNGEPIYVEAHNNTMEQQALEDFLKDEHIDLSSPFLETQNSIESIPVIKTEPNIPMLRCSSSIPDDEILSAILNAPIHQNNLFGSFQEDSITQQYQETAISPLKMETLFLRKYFRNDRKNLQCFPYCREHGNYYEAKMNGLEHAGKGVCRAPVKVKVNHTNHAPPTGNQMIVLARCQRKNQPLGAALNDHMTAAQLQDLQSQTWVRGTASEATASDTTVYFLPEVWKFDGELPKKRRQEESDEDDLQYCVQVVLFTSDNGGQTYMKAATTESNCFDIQSTRTLLRQKQRKDGADDTLIGVPEKKRMKFNLATNGRYSMGDVNIDLNVMQWGKPGEDIEEDFESESSEVEVSPGAKASPDSKVSSEVKVSPPEHSSEPVPFVSVETPTHRHIVKDENEANSSWKERFVFGPLVYSFVGIPVGVLCLLVHFILLPIVWTGTFAFNLSDGIADMDLFLANSLSPPEDSHVLLRRLSKTSDLINRICYYILIKLPVTLIAFCGSLIFTILAVVTIIVPPLSRSLRVAGNTLGMVAISGCKNTCGQKQSPQPSAQRGDIV